MASLACFFVAAVCAWLAHREVRQTVGLPVESAYVKRKLKMTGVYLALCAILVVIAVLSL